MINMDGNLTGPISSPNHNDAYQNISLPVGVSIWYMNCTDGTNTVESGNRTIRRVPYEALTVTSSGGLSSLVTIHYELNSTDINYSSCYLWTRDSDLHDPTYLWQRVFDTPTNNVTVEAVVYKENKERLALTCIDTNNNYYTRNIVANPTNSFNMIELLAVLGACILAFVYAFQSHKLLFGVIASALFLVYAKLGEYMNVDDIPGMAMVNTLIKIGLGISLFIFLFSHIKERFMEAEKKESEGDVNE